MLINKLTFISLFILFSLSACNSAVIDTENVQSTQSTSIQSVQEIEKPNDQSNASTADIKHTLWKVKGETNRADVLTKFKDGESLKKQLDWTSQRINVGRHPLAPKLSGSDPLEEALHGDADDEEEQLGQA